MNEYQTRGRNRWDLEAHLIQKASADPDFRRDLLYKSKQVIEQELGEGLPEGVAVVVLNEKPGEIIVVLPFAGHTALGSLQMDGQDESNPDLRFAATRLRAAEDPGFRQRLSQEPQLLVGVHPDPAQAGGRKGKTKVRICQENAYAVQIVLPHPGNQPQGLGAA